MTLIAATLDCGPFGTMLLRGWDISNNAPFSAQAFASQMNSVGSDESCWTSRGKVRCRGGIDFADAR